MEDRPSTQEEEKAFILFVKWAWGFKKRALFLSKSYKEKGEVRDCSLGEKMPKFPVYHERGAIMSSG